MARRIGLDLDETLISAPYGTLWFRPWVAREEQEAGVEPGTFLRRLREAGNARWRRGRWVDAYDWPALTTEVVGHPIPDPPVPPAARVWPLVRPGALRLMAWLWDRRVELVLVTNGFWTAQRPFLAALGWHDRFVRWAAPDVTGAAKPDPRIFDAVGPLDAFVGDRPWHDVLGARRAGIPAVLVGSGPRQEDRWDPLGRVPEPDRRVPHLDALLGLWDQQGIMPV
jgi:FMN phosphatase YigB (HAD superfamily)